MHKSLFTVLALFVVVHTSPADLDSDFDALDTDLDNLSYPVEEEDLDDYSKLFDEDSSKTEKTKNNAKTTGYQKKNAVDKGVEKKYNLEDLKKIFKLVASHDAGTKDDADVYGFVNGLIGTKVGIAGNESRTYKKGTKTRGYHRVQHKDEYKKDNEFYEDDETSGVIRKNGAKGLGFKVGGGAAFDEGYYHHDRDKGLQGEQSVSDVGSGKKQYSGYSNSQGFDKYFLNKK